MGLNPEIIHIFISTAAVADYKPKDSLNNKLKKQNTEDISIELKQNKDILDTSTGVFNDIIDYIFKNDNFESDEDRKLVLERVTRYIIGYQIEYCLRTNESCNVVCEC